MGEQNALLAVPWSNNSQALVPIAAPDAIVNTTSNVSVEHANNRYRIEHEQANAALETPSTYQEAMKSPQSNMWRDAIKTELKTLQSMST